LVLGIDSRGVIKCLNPETGEVRVVTDASPLGLGGWGGNTWMGLDAEDRPLVLSSPSVVAGVHVVYLKKP